MELRRLNKTPNKANHCGKPRCPAAKAIYDHMAYQLRPARIIARQRLRQANLRRATPKWLTEQDWEQINGLYLEARRLTKETGIKHHVDHELPLRGRYVSGLHVPSNLRVITAEENLKRPKIYRPE